MADILKLKKKAADFEAKKQTDKALDVYREIIQAYEDGNEDSIDIPLYNRVGDMFQKTGNLPEAVSMWEKAVDHYTEGGFFNPAIALCNKILRASPGRTVIYYKLGKIHAEKGFKGDARQNFLEYASRQQKAGNLDDAFKALKEFAELVPDQYDVRLMLADQLVKAGLKDDAIAQLQLGYTQASADGNADAAHDLAAKMKEIDPSVEPLAKGRAAESGGGGLVFLDLEDGSAPPAPKKSARPTPLSSKRMSRAIEGLALMPSDPIREPPTMPSRETAARAAADAAADATAAAAAVTASAMQIEPTNVGAGAPPPPRGSLMGLQATNLAEDTSDDLPLLEVEAPVLESISLLEAEAPSTEIPLLDLEPTSTADIPLLDLEPTSATDLPLLDLEPTPTAGIPLLDKGATPASVPLIEVDPISARTDLQEARMPTADDLELIEPEPSLSDDLPFITEEPSFGGDLPMLEGEESSGGDLSLLSDEQTAGIEFEPMTEALEEAIEEASSAAESTNDLVFIEDASAGAVPSAVPNAVTSASSGPVFAGSPDMVEAALAAEEAQSELVEQASGTLLGDAPISTTLSVGDLGERMAAAPTDFSIRRQFAEALLENGDRTGALRELEAAMAGFEQQGDLDTAGSIAEEIVRLEPKSIRHHQKRVEFAFRANDRTRLAEAYVELADALLVDGQAFKARAVYQRVLDIRPEDLRAQAAIESIPQEEEPSVPLPPRRSTTMLSKSSIPAAPVTPARAAPKKDDEAEYVSLGDWLREDDEPKSTRMVVQEEEPTGDEAADFADMLRKFKQGVSDNVEEEDHEAHYDLGVAYKEMGLLDEAISEFQKALRGTTERTRAFEALGHCFLEKGQLPVAATILSRALAEPGVRDESLVGVLYLLGAISEEQKGFADAKKYYERVFAVDIQFRDVGDRLNAVEQHLK